PLEASVAVATAGLVTFCAFVRMPIGRVLTRLPAAVGFTLWVTVQMEPALIVMPPINHTPGPNPLLVNEQPAPVIVRPVGLAGVNPAGSVSMSPPLVSWMALALLLR